MLELLELRPQLVVALLAFFVEIFGDAEEALVAPWFRADRAGVAVLRLEQERHPLLGGRALVIGLLHELDHEVRIAAQQELRRPAADRVEQLRKLIPNRARLALPDRLPPFILGQLSIRDRRGSGPRG